MKQYQYKIKGEKREINWNYKKYYRRHKRYKLFKQVFKKCVNQHVNDAFLYFCKINTNPLLRKQFQDYIESEKGYNRLYEHNKRIGYCREPFGLYIDSDYIIRYQDRKPKKKTLLTADYKVEKKYFNKKTKREVNPLWFMRDTCNIIETVISGKEYEFDSKNNREYKRLLYEKNKAIKKRRKKKPNTLHPNDIVFQIIRTRYKKEPFPIDLNEYGIELENSFRTKEQCEKVYNCIPFNHELSIKRNVRKKENN